MYGIRDEYATEFGRQVLTVWRGAFSSDYVGRAVELPRHDGYMLAMFGERIRVTCPAPRTDDNWRVVDSALATAARRAMVKHEIYAAMHRGIGEVSGLTVTVQTRTHGRGFMLAYDSPIRSGLAIAFDPDAGELWVKHAPTPGLDGVVRDAELWQVMAPAIQRVRELASVAGWIRVAGEGPRETWRRPADGMAAAS